VVDGVMQWLIVQGLAPQQYYLLTVKGRKTGLPRTKPVALVENGERKWLVTPYGAVNWVWNARATGKVRLKRGKYQQTFRIIELPVEERAPILKRYISFFAITQFYFDARPDDPEEAFIPEARSRPVFELHKQEAS
jgi:deazaflavin-dependent oxidoreductase (nitroreductase family)